MAENLKTTKYNDGSIIPLVTDNTEWGALNMVGKTSQNAWNVGLSYGSGELGFSNQSKNNGFSVRCVHDN